MKFIIRYAVVVVAIISFSIMGPHFYKRIFIKYARNPFIYYSVLKGDFLMWKLNDKEDGLVYSDTKGKVYKRKMFESLLPFRYYHDLIRWEIFPDEIEGRHITYKDIRNSQYSNSYRPVAVDLDEINIKLRALIESKSQYSKLTFPSDMFRIADRMEFIVAKTNKIDEEKSRLFTDALKKQNFAFPAVKLAGNMTTLKPYDDGYFVLDSAGGLFHIKMIRGKPFVKKVKTPDGINIGFMQVVENNNFPYHAIIYSKDGKIYNVKKETYEFVKLPIEGFDLYRDRLNYAQDPVNKKIKINNKKEIRMIVLDYDNNIIKTGKWDKISSFRGVAKTVYDIVFPYSLAMENSTQVRAVINLKFTKNKAAFAVVVLLVGIYAAIRSFRRVKPSQIMIDSLFILVGGIYSFTALLLLGSEPDDFKKG